MTPSTAAALIQASGAILQATVTVVLVVSVVANARHIKQLAEITAAQTHDAQARERRDAVRRTARTEQLALQIRSMVEAFPELIRDGASERVWREAPVWTPDESREVARTAGEIDPANADDWRLVVQDLAWLLERIDAVRATSPAHRYDFSRMDVVQWNERRDRVIGQLRA